MTSGTPRNSFILPVTQMDLSLYVFSGAPNFGRSDPQMTTVKIWSGYDLIEECRSATASCSIFGARDPSANGRGLADVTLRLRCPDAPGSRYLRPGKRQNESHRRYQRKNRCFSHLDSKYLYHYGVATPMCAAGGGGNASLCLGMFVCPRVARRCRRFFTWNPLG